ncbi:MAG TPA: DUF397 domain-containing protein [Streptosporangiaceae bacterium]|jgi:Domain of unknown function (DUF397)|nr:DUF397 domain-containing protein [Streptosporangiaceae bacterium]
MLPWTAIAGTAAMPDGRQQTVMFTMNAQPGAVQRTGQARAHWFKSSYSAYNGNCVEVAMLAPGWVGVRDSKAGAGAPVLRFRAAEWQSLIQRLRAI